MIWALITGGLLLFILICLLTIELEFKVIIKNKENHSFVVMRLLNRKIQLRYNLEIERDKEDALIKVHLRKTDKKLVKTKTLMEIYETLKKMMSISALFIKPMRYLRSKMRIENFSMLSSIGIEHEAALTALLSGSILAIFNAVLDFITCNNPCKHRNITINPIFNRSIFQIDMDCIINLKIGYIIITGYKFLVEMIRKR